MFDQRGGVRTSRIICTTPTKDTLEGRQRAARVGDWFGCPVVVRRNRTLRSLFAAEQAETVIVADEQAKIYHRAVPDTPLFFHPGMARQRLLGMRRGEPDRMVVAAGVREGDTVLDATFGLGTDSLVFAAAVGPQGRVIGIERSWILVRLFQAAQSAVPSVHPYPAVLPLLSHIDVMHANHLSVLQSMPDDSADVVYFDPMFRHSPKSESNLDPARPWVMQDALADAAWSAACRVARRSVLFKERPGYGQFERFGIEPDKHGSRIAFGVWRKGDDGGNRDPQE